AATGPPRRDAAACGNRRRPACLKMTMTTISPRGPLAFGISRRLTVPLARRARRHPVRRPRVGTTPLRVGSTPWRCARPSAVFLHHLPGPIRILSPEESLLRVAQRAAERSDWPGEERALRELRALRLRK